MRILFATTHSFPPQRTGGIEASIDCFCRAMSGGGLKVGVLCSIAKGSAFFFRSRISAKLSGNPYSVDKPYGYPIFRCWFNRVSCSKVCEKFRPDVVVIAGSGAGSYELAKWFNSLEIPILYEIHDAELGNHGGDLGTTDAVFSSVSSFIAGKLKDETGRISEVVFPPIDAQRYRVERNGRMVVLINPDPSKGGEVVVSMAEKRRDIQFLIQECWPSNSQLHHLKARAIAAGNVYWEPPVSDMRSVYKKAHLLLVPSQCEEAYSRVVVEAQVSGIPVLATNIGGIPEAVGDGGRLVSPNAGIEEWCDELANILDNAENYGELSDNALRHSQRAEVNLTNIIQTRISQCEKLLHRG